MNTTDTGVTCRDDCQKRAAACIHARHTKPYGAMPPPASHHVALTPPARISSWCRPTGSPHDNAKKNTVMRELLNQIYRYIFRMT
jgi:hypothetical protein